MTQWVQPQGHADIAPTKRVRDLYCGAGGVARGLIQAGFSVTGVDIFPHPRYPGEKFIQADALRDGSPNSSYSSARRAD